MIQTFVQFFLKEMPADVGLAQTAVTKSTFSFSDPFDAEKVVIAHRSFQWHCNGLNAVLAGRHARRTCLVSGVQMADILSWLSDRIFAEAFLFCRWALDPGLCCRSVEDLSFSSHVGLKHARMHNFVLSDRNVMEEKVLEVSGQK